MVLDVKAKSRNRSLKRNQQAKQAKHNVKISIKALGGDGNEKKDANDDRVSMHVVCFWLVCVVFCAIFTSAVFQKKMLRYFDNFVLICAIRTIYDIL